MDNNNLFVYINRIINHVIYWKDRLHLTEQQGFKVSDKSINELRKRLRTFIEKIIKSGKDYLLTEDFCYYLVYESFKMVDYQKELFKLLDNIIKASDNELIKILNKYMFYVCFGDIYNIDKQENYVKLMNQEDLDMFNTCMNCIHNMYQTGVKCFESDILTEILFNIYGYCIIHHQKDIFGQLVNKYFSNPRQTIDYFLNNGFMTKDYNLKDNFNDFIYQDMNKEEKTVVIK